MHQRSSSIQNNLYVLKIHIVGIFYFILCFQCFSIQNLECSDTKWKVYKHAVNSAPAQEFTDKKKAITIICTHSHSISRVRDYYYEPFFSCCLNTVNGIFQNLLILEKILTSYILTCPSPGIPPPSRRSLSIFLEKQKQRKNVPNLWSVY